MSSSKGSDPQMSGNDFSEFDEETSFSVKDYRFEDWIAFSAFVVLALTVFAQFFSRYVLGSSLGWTEEVARYLLVCVGFLGASMGVRKNVHISVTLFTRLLPDKVEENLALIVAVFNSVFILMLMAFCFKIIPRIHIYEMASIPLPLSVLYCVVCGSLILMFIRSLLYLFKIRKSS